MKIQGKFYEFFSHINQRTQFERPSSLVGGSGTKQPIYDQYHQHHHQQQATTSNGHGHYQMVRRKKKNKIPNFWTQKEPKIKIFDFVGPKNAKKIKFGFSDAQNRQTN